MATRFVPSLQEILYRLSGAATDASLKAEESPNPGRFPVVVRPQTRAFLEAQAGYLGGSIAGVAGAILDGVAMATQGRDGGAAAMRGVAERFNILIQEHGLSFPAAVEALSDLGFTLADLASVETLQLKLTSPVLRSIASKFFVNYDWLAGKSDLVFSPTPHCWYKEMETAANKLVAAKKSSVQTELTLIVKKNTDLELMDDNQPWDQLPHFFPVLIQTRSLPGGEILKTYEVWDEGRWSYWRCREHIKLVVYFAQRLGVTVTGTSITAAEYESLSSGKSLPVTILRRNLQVTWYPDDYVHSGSPVSKENAAWNSILQNPEYSSTLAYFDQLLNNKEVKS